jgi:hypothetical protein
VRLPVLAGLCSTVLFAVAALPMLVRAWRTRDLRSYSRGQLVLSNVGNVVHSVYVLSLPPGPIWALHGFYLASTALMLWWHVRHVPSTGPDQAEPCGASARPSSWSTALSGSFDRLGERRRVRRPVSVLVPRALDAGREATHVGGHGP